MKTLTSTLAARRRRLRSKAGYTLVEILIVITIIGLLVTVVGTSLFKILDNQKVNVTRTQIDVLKKSLQTMDLDIGRYPTEAEGLALLLTNPGDSAPGWNGPYLDKPTLPVDPWGTAYKYLPPASGDDEPKIESLGNDHQEGGTKNAADIIQ